MGLVLRTVGGCVAAACALSLSGAAAAPVAERVARLVPDVASVTQLATDAMWRAVPDQTLVTAEVDTGYDEEALDLFGGTGGSAVATASRPSAAQLAIPAGVLRAYQRAADRISRETPGCGLRWEVLAGIGKIESNHARGGRLDADGVTVTPIIGPVLNGVGPVAAIRDTDDGRWDGDSVWDRAVGPMQFIPGTWRAYGVDGTGDGEANPHNVWDATLTAGRYLCAGGADLTTDAGLRSALLRYNRSTAYVANVINWINGYADGSFRAAAGGATGGGSGAANDGSSGSSGSNGSGGVPRWSGTTARSPEPTKASSPSRTPTTTPTRTPTTSPSPTPTKSPTPTESPTPTPTPSESPSPSPTPTESPTPTPTPSESPSPSPSPTPTESPTPTPPPDPDPTECPTEPDDGEPCDEAEGTNGGAAGESDEAARTEDD
jgi:membrane-bound lytic murein transglycosylase B